MPGWGIDSWGFTPWGLGQPEVPPGVNPPLIVLRAPLPDSQNVPVNAVVTVGFFDLDLDLNTLSAKVYVDGIVAYDGGSGFSSGYSGTTYYATGKLVVQLVKLNGWGFSEEVVIRGYIEDSGGRIADDTWRWNTLDNPVCYTGLTPLPAEINLQAPMVQFLDLEPVRQLMLNAALRTTTSVKNAGNKAARALYQQAFNTEISTVLNLFVPKDIKALAVTVCEKQKIMTIDQQLAPYMKKVRVGIQQLYNLGVLSIEYVNSFNDYLDSTLYNYRVSAVCNVLFLARSIEVVGT